jgi:hypothetical protein
MYRWKSVCTSGSSVASGAEADGPGSAVSERGVREAVRCDRPSLDCAGVYSAGLVVAGVLLHPLGAAVGRADQLQPAVSLVRRPGHGRCGMAPRGVFEEP